MQPPNRSHSTSPIHLLRLVVITSEKDSVDMKLHLHTDISTEVVFDTPPCGRSVGWFGRRRSREKKVMEAMCGSWWRKRSNSLIVLPIIFVVCSVTAWKRMPMGMKSLLQ